MDELRKLPTVSAQETARIALAHGFPITCATCEHLKNAWERNNDDCGRTLTCGGPIFNRSYPNYLGPVKAEDYDKICLRCGSAQVAYRVYGGVRPFGLCEAHKGIFDKVDGPGTQRPLITRVSGQSL